MISLLLILALRNLGIQCKSASLVKKKKIHLDRVSKRTLTNPASTVDVSKLRYFIQGSLVTTVTALRVDLMEKAQWFLPHWFSYSFASEQDCP